MKNNGTDKIFEPVNIEFKLNEYNICESFISKILNEENFMKLNNIQNNKNLQTHINISPKISISTKKGNIEFISLEKNSIYSFSALIREDEFFKIIGLTKKGLSVKSGKYQESLYSYYLKAKEEDDDGFLSDILNKAAVFNNNLNYVKKLTKNKKFMKEWHKNFGKESPVKIFKNCGNLRKINIVSSGSNNYF